MLVDEIGNLLVEPDNFNTLVNVFENHSKQDLTEKGIQEVLSHVILNKFYATIFNRLIDKMPDFLENEALIKTINSRLQQIMTSCERVKHKTYDENVNFCIKNFKDYYSTFVDFYDKLHKLRQPDINDLEAIILKTQSFNKDFILDEKSNLAYSKIIKIADTIDTLPMKENLFKLSKHLIKILNIAQLPKTINNTSHVLCNLIKSDKHLIIYNKQLKEDILEPILNFMTNKPKLRLPVYFN